MSNPALRPEDQRRFVLKATPPIRAYAVAAAGSIVAGVLLVGWQSGWPLLLGLLGGLLLILALALATAATILTWRFQATLVVRRDTLTVITGRRQTVLNWRDISSIEVKGARLIISVTDAERPVVAYVDPRRVGQPEFQELGGLLAQRLDASRGYRAE